MITPESELPPDERDRQIEEAWRQHNESELDPSVRPNRKWVKLHFRKQKGICPYCKGEMTLDLRETRFSRQEDEWSCATLDHIVSQSNQGPDTFDNTCAACNGCNNAKGSFPLALFLAWCEYAIQKYDDIAERRRYLKLEADAERQRLDTINNLPKPQKVKAGISWIKYHKNEPKQNIGVLVRMDLLGPIYDIAVYRGIQPNGDRRWILSDVTLDYTAITHFAYIDEPEEFRTKQKDVSDVKIGSFAEPISRD